MLLFNEHINLRLFKKRLHPLVQASCSSSIFNMCSDRPNVTDRGLAGCPLYHHKTDRQLGAKFFSASRSNELGQISASASSW